MSSDHRGEPDHTRVSLGRIASVTAGGTPSRTRPDYWGGDIPWIATGQIDFGVIRKPSEYITKTGLDNSSAKVYPAGTVVMAMFGQGVTRGKVGILGIRAAFNQACVAIVPNDGDNARYLYHHLEHDYRRIRQLSQASSQSNLNAEIIKSLPINRFSLSVQQQIALIGDRWDLAAETVRRLLRRKRNHLRGLMQQLLTGRCRLPAFAEQPWDEVHIRDVGNEVSERCGDCNDIPVLSCTKSVGLVDSMDYFGRKVFGDDLSNYKVVHRNQFAYATNHIEEGSIGLLTHRDRGLVSPMYTVFATNGQIDTRFLYRVLKTERYRQKFEAWTSASVNRRGGLRWNEFSAIKIPLPLMNEQRVIADVLDTAQQEIELLIALREQIQKQKRGLMQKLLTGQIQIPEITHG